MNLRLDTLCITGLLHVRYDGDDDDDGDVGMRALTLVSGFCSLHGAGELGFMVRRRCTGSKINALSERPAPVHDRCLRDIAYC